MIPEQKAILARKAVHVSHICLIMLQLFKEGIVWFVFVCSQRTFWLRIRKVLYSYLVAFLTLATVLPAKSDSNVMFCLQSYQRLSIDR